MKKFMITWMSHNIAADHYETNQVCVDGVPFVTNDFDVAVQHMAELLDDDQDSMDGDGSHEIEGDEGTYIHSDGIVKYKIVEFEEPDVVKVPKGVLLVNDGVYGGKLFEDASDIIGEIENRVFGPITLIDDEDKDEWSARDLFNELVECGSTGSKMKVHALGLVEMGDDYVEMSIVTFD